MLSVEFQDYYNDILNTISRSIGSSGYSKKLCKNNYFRIKTGFYEDENPNDIVDEILLSVKDSLNESVLLNEAKSIYEPIRQIVRSIIDIVKSEEYGDYNLPEDISDVFEYDFEYDYQKYNLSRSYNIPSFSIELNYQWNQTIKEPYMINASLLSDGDTIYITIIINPKHYPQLLYDLIADLNDIILHEIEHIYQDNYMRPEDEMKNPDINTSDMTSFEYYQLPHEVPAQLVGLKRIAKLRKQPINKTIEDWIIRNKYNHDLTEIETIKLVDFLTKEYEKRYGKLD